ncbi:MAG: hypothetical protein ACRD30_09130, partial [Bryobacteraceae bacterium]
VWFNLAGWQRQRAAAVLISLLLVIAMGVNYKTHLIDVHFAKGNRLAPERFSAWNSFSRVGVSFHGVWNILIDADAATSIASFDWDRLTAAERTQLTHDGPGTPYLVRPGAKTLVIGAGGGYDVARAFASGSRDISAVEINPIIANKIMRGEFVKENRGLYFRPEVRLFVEDGRSFVRHSREKYQVIEATLVDTWASTAAGAFALSENNLYTTDAFYDYLTHLTPDGVLAFTRWGFDPPRESLRLLSLGIDALHRVGQDQPWRNFMVLRSDAHDLNAFGAQDTVLISREPFSPEDLTRMRADLAETGIEILYMPDAPVSNEFGRLLRGPDRQAFLARYPFDVKPVGDDRPFFFYTVQPRDVLNFLEHGNRLSEDRKVNKAVPLLFGLVGVSIFATLLILLLPRAVLGSRLPKQKGVLAFLWFFLCLGAGYILIQVALIQKFVLLLGHPTDSLTVTVFAMLVASGIGSYFSRKWIRDDDTRLIGALIAIAILVAALAFAAPSIASAAA